MPRPLIQGTADTHPHWGERPMSRLATSLNLAASNYGEQLQSESATRHPMHGRFTLRAVVDHVSRVQDDAGWTRRECMAYRSASGRPGTRAAPIERERSSPVLGCSARWSRSSDRLLAASVVSAGPTAWIALSIVFLASGLLAPVSTAKD